MKLGSKTKFNFTKITNYFLDIFIFIFGIILLITFYNVIQVRVLGNDYSSFFGYSLFEVQSGSMEPAISKGDWIIVREENQFEVGDIITFKQNEAFITHRINEIKNDTYVTKGDANNDEDDEIVADQIVGEVSNILESFGILRATIFNPYVLFALIITVYLLNTYKSSDKEIKGDAKMNKFKEIINNFISKFKNDDFKSKSLFEEEPIKRSFENISVKPTLQDYEEKIENYADEYDEDDYYENVDIKKDEYKFDAPKEPEEDLSKTIFFRIISVDEDGNSELVEENPSKSNEVEEVQEELVEQEKEIEQEELDEDSKSDIENILEPEPEEEPKENEDKLKLEMIFSKPEHRRSKNVIARSMAIKEEEINLVIDAILKDEKLQVNEASIKKLLIKSYMESKYYNIFSEKVANLEKKKSETRKKYVNNLKLDFITDKNGFKNNYKTRVKKLLTRISNALEEDATKIAKQYTGNDKMYEYKVVKFASLLMLVAKLEYLVDLPIDIKSKRMIYTKEIIKFMTDFHIENESIETTVKEVIKGQKEHRHATDYFLDKLNTEVFELIYRQLKNNKSKYILNLKHNITFSQVYSDHVVQKAYQEGIVAEDKLTVLFTLLQARLVSDMLTSDFANEYIVVIPNSLCQKENKFERLFKLNSEEYAKKNIIYLVDYDQFMKHASLIKMLRKTGFRISMLVHSNTKFSSKNKLNISLAESIYIDKDIPGVSQIEKTIFDSFKDKIIKDEIMAKLEKEEEK